MELCSTCHRFLETHSASELLQPLETSINSQLITALTGQNPTGDLVRQVLALPTYLGGLGPDQAYEYLT